MRKFFAVVKREYLKIVKAWTFLIGTLLLPVIGLAMAVVPALMFSIKGNAVRLAIVDQSGEIAERFKANLSLSKLEEKSKEAMAESFKDINPTQDEKLKRTAEQFSTSFVFEEVNIQGKTADLLRVELNERIKQDKIDAYIIIPKDYDSKDAKFEYFSRNTSDFFTKEIVENGLFDAVRNQRLAKANIDEAKLKEINRPLELSITKVSEKGEEKDNGTGFGIAFAVALMIYIVLTLYGQLIMMAVIEEKETKISEVLFSSAKPFELLMGKLIGVGLAGMTQIGIWLATVALFAGFALASIAGSGVPLELPKITVAFAVYVIIYFLLGFFTFASIFALLGAIAPSAQEVGSLAVIPVFLSLGGIYSVFPIIRDPNSMASTLLSMAPFVSPMAMPARILTEMPPFWQIGISIIVNLATIAFLVWVAARVYRVGMLMYGKKPTIPELWRWIWQS